MWDFVVPEEEEISKDDVKPSTTVAAAEYRPDRMGLGCSKEMIHEKISENAKKARLSKLLKRKGFDEDGNVKATSKLFKSEIDGSDDDEVSKSKIIKKKIEPIPPIQTLHASTAVNLTKSQKKRMKQKQKQIQRSLLAS
jgi:hypothetical protein